MLFMQIQFKSPSFMHPMPAFLHLLNVNDTLKLNLIMGKADEVPASWSLNLAGKCTVQKSTKCISEHKLRKFSERKPQVL